MVRILANIIVLMSLLISDSFAWPLIMGEYQTMDGNIVHDFKMSGDYIGQVNMGLLMHKVAGLYQQGDEVCLVNRDDGLPSLSGNVLLYYEEIQCCLELRKISDKLAVIKIWVKGAGNSYAICNNHVLVKKKK